MAKMCLCRKDIKSTLFRIDELIKFYLKNVFLWKISSLYNEFDTRRSFHYEKSKKILTCSIASLNAQLKVNMSEGYVGRTKMIPDFEIMDEITKPCSNEHWFEVENKHVLKVLYCFFLHNDTGQSQ